jgi:hypothetical protein
MGATEKRQGLAFPHFPDCSMACPLAGISICVRFVGHFCPFGIRFTTNVVNEARPVVGLRLLTPVNACQMAIFPRRDFASMYAYSHLKEGRSALASAGAFIDRHVYNRGNRSGEVSL